jgi:DNA polymerase-3 subunit beta
MKFICTQENLVRGLAHVSPIAGRNSQLPVLQHVLCQVKEGVLHLTATDLEIGVHTVVAGKVEATGSCTVTARKVLEFVQQLPGTHPLYVEKVGNNLVLTTEGFRAQFPTGEAEEFPLLPTTPQGLAVTVPAPLLCDALTHTLFAAAREETRPEIRSVFIKGEGQELRLAATDSFRLSEEILQLEQAVADFSVLVPLPTAQEIVRLFSDSSILTMLPHENYLAFHAEGLEVSSRLVEGTYPDYRPIIPTTHQLQGQVEREALIRALKTVAVFLPRDMRRVQVTFAPEDENLLVRVTSGEAGEGEVVVPFTGEGTALQVLFNIHYVLEGLQHLDTTHCQLQLGGTTDPAVFRPVGSERQYVYVVMPIQV